MAITKTRISSAQNKAVFKITATAAADTVTIVLATDLIHEGQAVATPKVNIARMAYSCSSSGDITIVRNGVTTHKLFGHDSEFQAPTAEQNLSDIVVTFNNTAGGTLILELSKVDGYGAINPPGLPY